MRKSLTRGVILLLIFFPVSVPALTLQEQKSLAQEGVELLLRRDYPRAKELMATLLRRDPDSLLGHLGMLCYSQLRNFENYDYRFESDYLPWADGARRKALEIGQKSSSTAWELLLAGGTLGVIGFQKGHHYQWIAAFRDGHKGVELLRRATHIDPEMTDALIGIGLYDYWRSHYTHLLHFLPFFSDQREEGKQQLSKASQTGLLLPAVAAVSLATIDYFENRHAEVIPMTRSFLQRYPQNTIVRMLEGQAYLKLQQFPGAIHDFEQILDEDPTLTKCWLFLGLAYAREGKDPKRARDYLTRYLKLEPEATPHWRRLAEQELEKL